MQIHGLINCSGRGQAIANVSLATGRCGPGLARLRPVRRGCCARVAGKDPSDKELADKFFPGPGSRASSPEGVGDVRPDTPSSAREPASKSVLDNVNPYELGRQARRAFDDVWENISSITAPTKSYVFDDVLDPSASMEADPRAAATTVLVAGATGRVGRILIRKLLLRGYRVRALIRRREGIRESSADVEGLPAAVEVVTGDVGELADVQRAVKGVDKVSTRAYSYSACMHACMHVGCTQHTHTHTHTPM
jgi:NAD(P)H-binding